LDARGISVSGSVVTHTAPTTHALTLRPAQDSDFWAVAQLFGDLHTFNAALDQRFRLADGWEARLRSHFMQTYSAPGALWLLAWDDTQPVGLLLMEAHTDSPLFAERQWAELVALYVAPAQRGGDLGRRLVAIGKQWAATNGFDRLQLYVTAANAHAKRFYARCGLRPTQEIWRADLQPTPGVTPPADPSCPPNGHAEHQLELGHHHLAME
jgi:GNAT superfamily N-acetyltransferase